MLDARLQARLAQNYADAASGYATASMAAFSAAADRAFSFWLQALPGDTRPTPAGRRDHLSWYDSDRTLTPSQSAASIFDPWAGFNAWTAAVAHALDPKTTAPGMQAMAMTFGPYAAWWSRALGAPNMAWPMAYSMIASGVPATVAWPTAEANAAMLDAGNAVSKNVEHAFSSYQSAGGYASAHVWGPKVMVAFCALAPFANLWHTPGA